MALASPGPPVVLGLLLPSEGCLVGSREKFSGILASCSLDRPVVVLGSDGVGSLRIRRPAEEPWTLAKAPGIFSFIDRFRALLRVVVNQKRIW